VTLVATACSGHSGSARSAGSTAATASFEACLLTEPPDVRVWRLGSDSFQELPWKLIGPTGELAGALQPTPPTD